MRAVEFVSVALICVNISFISSIFMKFALNINSVIMKSFSLFLASVLFLSVLPSVNAQSSFDKEGHRGGRGLMPENTIPAMKNAMLLGVNTLEMDIHITKDKRVVVAHDPHLNYHFTSFPDGREMTKNDKGKYALYDMDYADVRRYDVGSKYYDNFPRQKKLATYIPLLSELIDSVEFYAQEKHLSKPHYNIEAKLDENGDGVLHPAPEEFLQLMMAVICSKKIEDRVIIQSFDPRAIEIVHRDYPDVRTAFLVANLKSCKKNLKALTFKPDVYSPYYKMVNKKVVEYCHSLGISVIPWTVNSVEKIEELKDIDVDGIITDYPDLFNED